MARCISKRLPKWLSEKDPDDPALSRRQRRTLLYHIRIHQARPAWCVGHRGFTTIKREARRRREAGEEVEIDHIVPLNSPLVCGLHVPWNLRVVHKLLNQKKSNIWWPDAPFEQLRIVEEEIPEPHQLRLV